WNNVFIQYNRLKDGSLQPLPSRHVDTGMGFERLVRVIQNKHSNYDTDIFSPLIDEIKKITQKDYKGNDSKNDIAIRVNADHIRAISFTIADGQLPSNTGSGYVIRRILRRAVRYYYSYLNYQQPLLFQLVPILADQFAYVFPELKKQEQFVSKVIREEEESFLRTIELGLSRLKELEHEAELSTIKNQVVIDGKTAFELYDTFGFPLDLILLEATDKGWKVDVEGYQLEMQKQKDRSKAASVTEADDWVVLKEGNTEFIGYDHLNSESHILRYRKVKSKGKEAFQLVLDKTPFFAESGGQVGDTGKLKILNAELKIIDTKKENDLIVHYSDRLPDIFDGEIMAVVDWKKRKASAIHHTATHLLHAALRKVLGTHVAQKGSLVNSDYLRFDFSHFSKMSDDEIHQVENIVNEKIRQNIPVVIKYMPKEEALKTGAMALFGEKYGDIVRVVTIDPSYSVELCGGTHVEYTGELGFFKILSESAIAAGVRRIEAISGKIAEDYISHQLEHLHKIKEVLKNPKDLFKAIESLIEENTILKKQLERFEQNHLKNLGQSLAEKAYSVNGVNFLGEIVKVPNTDSLKKLAFEIKQHMKSPVIALAAEIENKASVVLLFDDELVNSKKLDASAIIKQKIAPLIKGGGGGQKNLATAGGQDSSALHTVIEAIKSLL
ncbi:MAG: alanine--tRNA ligase, partial [Flavisolibacter sp.]